MLMRMVELTSRLAFCAAVFGLSAQVAHAASAEEAHSRWGVIERYCFECHNATDWAGELALDTMSFDSLANDAEVWESAVRKLRAGFMPPPGAKARPDAQT